MSTATPGYATNAQMKQAARIRAAARRGVPAAKIAAAASLDVSLVDRMLACHAKEGAAKLLAEYLTECKDKTATVSI